ncbi:MAG TPA: polysaccharide ABC transporter ATP-binding protein [Victivallales bacterium]|nr:polysaccharide ABC transporter ATP-binding protein [Victivallales bacterium]
MSKDVVIRIENLSKQYRLGLVSTGTISHDINRFWNKIRGKEDPYLKVGETNDRSVKGESEYVWALKDINLEIKQGERLGIIGRNGAGKSTILKILSEVTGPTTGKAKIKGKIGALLEIGTGFHLELTGRENIYLNGTILGMCRKEINRKLDEIISFAGIERYLDTPVKRYSSGMLIRLGFSVAAHLEPDILIVDEVLAVGDATFQKKAIGKMKEVSEGHGRTVLFVSHNMSAIKSLCTKAVHLNQGCLNKIGKPIDIIQNYIENEKLQSVKTNWSKNNMPGDNTAKLYSAKLIDEHHNEVNCIEIDKKYGIEIEYIILKNGIAPIPNIHVFSSLNEYAFVSSPSKDKISCNKGKYIAILWLNANLLNATNYMIGIALTSLNPLVVHCFEREALFIEAFENTNERNTDYRDTIPGILRPKLDWDCGKVI